MRAVLRAFCALCLAKTAAFADDRDLAYIEIGAVGGLPRSNISSCDPGIGTQLQAGFGVHRSPPLLISLFVGYRRMWTSYSQPQSMIGDVRVWTDDIMLGARMERELGARWRAIGQLHLAAVKLDSRQPGGLTDFTFHHDGFGAGVRAGVGYEIVDHLRAVLAVGYSHAETKYDDTMGVAWLSMDATLIGTL